MYKKYLDPIEDYDEISKWIHDESICGVVDNDDYYSLLDISMGKFEAYEYPQWVGFREACSQVEYMNEKHYNDHISFIAVRCMNSYHIVEKGCTRIKKLLK